MKTGNVMLVLVVFASLFLAGCSMKEFQPTTTVYTNNGERMVTEDPLIAMAREQEITKRACIAQKDKDTQVYRDMMSSGRLSEVGLLAMKQSEDMKLMSLGLVAKFTGKNMDECGGTNIFDALIAEVQAKNAAVGKVVDGVTTAAKWGIVGYFANEAIDSAFGSAGNTANFNNSGDASFDDADSWTSTWSNQRDTISTGAGATTTDDFSFVPSDVTLEAPGETVTID